MTTEKACGWIYAAVLGAFVSIGILASTLAPPREAYEPINTIAHVNGNCSGVAVAPHLILTAKHCVDDAETVSIKSAKLHYDPEAKVLWRGGFPKGLDLALVRTKVAFTPAKMACGDVPSVGDDAITIGNPASLTWTQTRVYIAALNRPSTIVHKTLLDSPTLIQFSGGIVGGQSGGALFNMSGWLLGITTLGTPMVGGNGGSLASYGFAIPISAICEALGRST